MFADILHSVRPKQILHLNVFTVNICKKFIETRKQMIAAF